ncbi:ATP-binding protein [Pseudomonadota bacterium]
MSQEGDSLVGRYLGPIFGTLRGQLILSVVLLNAVMMALFVWYLTDRQQDMLLQRQTEHAIALANSIATSSSGWLSARDYSGLQEIIDAQRRYPDLLFAMILDPQRHVLAHSDAAVVGKYLKDVDLSGPHTTESRIVSRAAQVVDVVTPVVLAGTDIGWVRIGLGQETTAKRLQTITRAGIVNGIVAILIGSLAVAFLGWRLTRRLYAIQTVADAIQAGERKVRVQLNGRDEAAKLGHAFDAMLNTLDNREHELQEHRDHLSELVEERTAELLRQNIFTEAVLENITEGIVACDEQGSLSYFNRATRLMHGIEQKNLPPEQWSEHYRLLLEDGITPMPTDQIPLFRAFNEEQVREQPMILQHTDGNPHFILCNGQAMYNEAGEKLGAVASLHDVTMQKEFETELIKARDDAENANRAKSVFLANMSHELRTPLNAILGFSSMMSKDPLLPEGLRQNIDIINRSGEHLLALINDVLEMAKIEAGRVELEYEPFDLEIMVQDVVKMMALRAHRIGLDLLIDQSSYFPRYIIGDEAHLRQILINLLGNAVKFTRKGSVILRLSKKENRASHLEVEVEDTGIGITPEDQKQVFEPFAQLGDQGASKGTGLGLTITRQFIQMMGGSISLESTPGKGSLFRFELPLNEAKESDISKLPQADKGEVAGLTPGQTDYRILIIEDQLENQLLLTKLLEDVGFQVKLAENGELGVHLFQSWQPHFIWMDRRMPVMDGMEATRRIRELPNGKKVKIVAVTASAFAEERKKMLEAGMDDYVRKPFRASEIYHCMAKHLGVEYLYQSAPAPEEQGASLLTPEMLEGLPESLRGELIEALVILDSKRIDALIRQVAAHDPALQKNLRRLAGDLDYSTILNALRGLKR